MENRKNDLILIMTPGKQDKTLELSKQMEKCKAKSFLEAVS